MLFDLKPHRVCGFFVVKMPKMRVLVGFCNIAAGAFIRIIMTLCDVKAGGKVVITAINGDAEFQSRTCALGLVMGAELRVIKAFYKGGAIIISRRGELFALRAEAGALIEVEVRE